MDPHRLTRVNLAHGQVNVVLAESQKPLSHAQSGTKNDLEWENELAGGVRQPKPAARFSETPVEANLSGAMRGQHTEEVLREIGRSDADVEALRDAGVIL